MANILVIETDPRLARMLEWVLEEAGHGVTVVATTADAGAYLDSNAPDLIVFNSNARVEDKRMLIRSFRDATPGVRIIDMDENAHHPTHDTGADDYIGKPFHADDLLASIDKLVGKRTQQDR